MTIYINKDTGVHWTEADITRMAYPLKEGIENGSYKVIVAISAPSENLPELAKAVRESIERSESPTPEIDKFIADEGDYHHWATGAYELYTTVIADLAKAVREDIRRLGK